MKLFVLISVAIAAVSASVIKDPSQGYKDGDRYFFFPGDDDHLLHLVDTLDPIDEEFIRSYTRDPKNNGYWLYTRANPNVSQVLVVEDLESVVQSNLDVAKDTVFFAHGWRGDGETDMNKQLTAAFLENGDVNAIVLDWGRLAKLGYIAAKHGTADIGHGLGQFILWLSENFGLSLDKVHLVGHSLGGHVVGNAGRELQGQVKRITALDPAGPLWTLDDERIVPTDGRYVEIIHTTTLYGYSDPCGHADYYPNGGSHMPGCVLSSCSHTKAWEYMAASVTYNYFLANECETHRDATRDDCTGTPQLMGNSDINKQETGIFRVDTGSDYPYYSITM